MSFTEILKVVNEFRRAPEWIIWLSETEKEPVWDWPKKEAN